MGKKAKRQARAIAKEKRSLASTSNTTSEHSEVVTGTPESVVTAVKECKPCPHLENGLDIKALTDKISGTDPGRCGDCRDGMADWKRGKGKAKLGNKKGDPSIAIWVCLQCGHHSCGGVGLPRIVQSHAVRHQKQTRHPLVIQLKNPNLRWCFPCDSLVSLEVCNEDGSKHDALLDVVKLLKPNSSVKQEDSIDSSLPSTSEKSDSYIVRGLTNLGNTCFFNAVMQNLLAMNHVRDYFMNHDASFGSLSISLKKAFNEARCDDGVRNVMNLRSLFGSVCSKAPQFRGYQQQDSHELLRYLLDGLSTEELAFNRNPNGSTFVESTFGGRNCSTVTCIECGFSSTIFEPFLDLSLSVPTKKAPPKSNARGKKSKLSPKRTAKIKSKTRSDKNERSLSTEAAASSDSTDTTQMHDENSATSFLNGKNDYPSESSFAMSWMEFVDLGNGARQNDSTSQNNNEAVSTTEDPPPTKQQEEEASSSMITNDPQEDQLFDGFVDLFNEPEVSRGNKSSESDLEQDDSQAPTSIESCLVHFTKAEILADDNAWDCENCTKRNGETTEMVKRDAKKKVVIDKAPAILTVHLKRFSQDGRGRLSKLNGPVTFGEFLDLRPYMEPREEEGKCVYRLLGVVEHLGTMRQGHYVAYVRGGATWFHASDCYVREVSFDEVLHSQPYIFFFERLS